MGSMTRSVLAVLSAVLSVFVYLQVKNFFYAAPPLPHFKNEWWGQGDPLKEDTSIKHFKINVSDEVLNDLKYRLDNALPFQPPLEGAKQHYGMNTELLTNIVSFWKTKYDWRAQETFLNQFPQFKTSIQGLDIHFLHVKPKDTKGKKVLPLLLCHGWPGSVREFYEIIPLLTAPHKDRDFVFEVVAPSLPGYGFSDAAVRPGLSPIKIAVIFKNLMSRLGFERYYLQGGDWGGTVVLYLTTLYPDKVIGVHSNLCFVNSALANFKIIVGSFFPRLVVDKKNEHKLYPYSERFLWTILESGYMHLQSTKPDTVGVALRDSPVGLAAYIIEKFTTWTNPAWKDLEDGGLTKKYSYTKLLDNVMIYWVTRSITTSMRLYAEHFSKENRALGIDMIPSNVPTACARFEHELVFTPDPVLKDKYHNLVQVSDLEGGHFPALEVPEILAADLLEFAAKVEKLEPVKN